MPTLVIILPDDRLLELQALAARFGVAPEELTRVGIEDLVAGRGEAFERAADHVLERITMCAQL